MKSKVQGGSYLVPLSHYMSDSLLHYEGTTTSQGLELVAYSTFYPEKYQLLSFHVHPGYSLTRLLSVFEFFEYDLGTFNVCSGTAESHTFFLDDLQAYSTIAAQKQNIKL